MYVGVSVWLGSSGIRVAGWISASACNTDTTPTTPTQPHRNSNTHRIKNTTTNEVIQHKLLMMDILMSETCWVHKKWNKIASDIKLVFYSSTVTMMHGPINIRLFVYIWMMPSRCARVTECYFKVPSIHNNWIAVVVLQLVNQATCFGRFIRPSSGLQNNIK